MEECREENIAIKLGQKFFLGVGIGLQELVVCQL